MTSPLRAVCGAAALCIALSVVAARADDVPAPDLPGELREAVRSNELERIAEVHGRVLGAAKERPDDYALSMAAALGYVARADLLRIDRHTGRVDSDTSSRYRDQQAEWGEAGAAFAERAVAQAGSPRERSEAHRLVAEATVHRISGPINGFRFGPVAKEEVRKALEIDPRNPEAMRAQGLMFLHNPPINGGDLEKAVETFTEVARLADGDVPHALLAQTWWKRGRPQRALLEAKIALSKNPENRLAQNVKARVEAGDEY